MFNKLLTLLSLASTATIGAVARPAIISVPSAGVYTVQNVGTGLALDVSGGSGAQGTPVVVSAPDSTTSSQQWTLSFPGPFAAFQTELSPSPFIHAAFDSASGLTFLDLADQVPSEFELTPSTTGINICFDPVNIGCFTSPVVAGGRVTLAEFTGAPNQTWVFTSAAN
ncbi:hypothetical protein PHLGIDRAFT_37051 [Phlebiopsis gigantea 11061_1 CR5-6]|uniref:Ricin B lectin domain-containing protein n=1 Tax=Phlebiopsis gigantea (strain 11061_1 CR5-6) TaxID=745531 RepID=A0A0C3PF95_PHLG1|nr:hypothetical protein PHLGIDRAFT_37051 [Phlebiopsis gigantea 11061_1 CR5-6]